MGLQHPAAGRHNNVEVDLRKAPISGTEFGRIYPNGDTRAGYMLPDIHLLIGKLDRGLGSRKIYHAKGECKQKHTLDHVF
jgi:hypothetical protein